MPAFTAVPPILPRPRTPLAPLASRAPARPPRPPPRRLSATHPPPSPAPPSAITVDLTLLDTTLPPSTETALRLDATRLLRHLLPDRPAELSLLLVSDAEIARLNHTWRGRPSATDVLSFPQDDRVVLGDVVISLDTARRQALREGEEALLEELRVLLVHGVLHLLGFDHEGDFEGDWRVMAEMERCVMLAMAWRGVGLVAAARGVV